MLEERVRIRSSFGILRDLTNQFDKFDALTIASPFGLGKQSAAPAPATTPDLGDSIQPKKRGKGASGEAFAKDAVATEETERWWARPSAMQENGQQQQPFSAISAIQKLSQTINSGVSEAMHCLSELRSENTVYESILKSVTDELATLKEEAAEEEGGDPDARGVAGAKTTNEPSPTAAGAQPAGQVVFRTPASCGEPRTSNRAGTSSSEKRKRCSDEGGRGRGLGAMDTETTPTPPSGAPGTRGGMTRYHLTCARETIEDGFDALEQRDTRGARRALRKAIEALQSVVQSLDADSSPQPIATRSTPPLLPAPVSIRTAPPSHEGFVKEEEEGSER